MDNELLIQAKANIERNGKYISLANQESILKQVVTLGMSLYEAGLASGAYAFEVEADTAVWPPNADPYIVISEQLIHPDNSKLWLTFESATQVPELGMRRFTAIFEKGRVVKIDKL